MYTDVVATLVLVLSALILWRNLMNHSDLLARLAAAKDLDNAILAEVQEVGTKVDALKAVIAAAGDAVPQDVQDAVAALDAAQADAKAALDTVDANANPA